MGDLFPEHLVIDVGMGIHVDEGDGSVLLLHRPEDGQRQGVVAAERQRDAVESEDAVKSPFDDAHRLFQIEGVDGHIADVGDLERVEGRCARGHVVGPQHAALRPDLARPVAGAGAVGGADVDGHADEAGIEPARRSLHRQAHHRRRARKARHLVAAQWLVEFFDHDTPPLTLAVGVAPNIAAKGSAVEGRARPVAAAP